MSDLTSKATVELLINGQQAQQTLAQLRQNALNLEGTDGHEKADKGN